MDRSSLHVSARTRKRLARYKEEGMSYDAILQALMTAIPPEEFRARWRAAEAEAARRLGSAAGRPTGAAPGERMELAFHLFRLARGEG